MLNKVINIVQCYIVLYSVLQSCMVLYSAILCDSVALHKEMGRMELQHKHNSALCKTFCHYNALNLVELRPRDFTLKIPTRHVLSQPRTLSPTTAILLDIYIYIYDMYIYYIYIYIYISTSLRPSQHRAMTVDF